MVKLGDHKVIDGVTWEAVGCGWQPNIGSHLTFRPLGKDGHVDYKGGIMLYIYKEREYRRVK